MSSEEWPEIQLIELGEDECWKLASGQLLGRIAWSSGSGPVALPVNYVVHERGVWIRTSAYSSLVREVDDNQVAFETDQIDPATHLGWSVLLRGTAEVRYRPEEVPVEVREHESWPAGNRPLWVHIVPRAVTGRRLATA